MLLVEQQIQNSNPDFTKLHRNINKTFRVISLELMPIRP